MKAKKWDEGMAGSGILYNEEASQQRSEIPPGPEEKTQEEFRLIGGMTPRIDGNEIVTGKAKFTHDIRLRGMLHGKILRSPHARAEIEAVDLSAARSLPGVKAAIRLAEKSIRYAGEEVAAVAAVEEKTAEKALGLIRVSYRPLPHAVTEERAREEDAPRVFEDQPNLRSFNTYERGDVDAGFREADAVIERTYRTAVEIHQTAETHVSIAAWDEDRLTVWDSTQAVHSVRDQLARALQVPASRIRVIKTYMGGGFGSKLGLNVHTLAAALLAREARRPVKIMLTRQENSVCVGNRPSTIQTLKGGVTRDGRLTALTMKNLTCGGLRRGDRCSEPLIDLHRCPNVRVEEISIATHTGPARPTRAPGQVQGTFALEGFLDELAAEIGMDPLELRRRNYSTKNRGDTGVPYSTKGLDRCYELGAEAIGWERRNMPPGAGIGRFRRGIGMASQIWWGAGVPGTLADLKLYPDGSVDVLCGTQDIGTGTRTHIAVVAAETLGLTPKDITVKIGNTDYPWAPSSGGSQTTPSVAPAVRDAALKAAQRLREIAARKLEVPAESVVLEKKRLFSRETPEKSLAFAEAARELRRETVFHGERAGFVPGYAYNTFGAHFAEVLVDTKTGKIRVLKVVAVHEIGRVINRQTAESQVIGGVTQGLSTALLEQRIMDEQTGRMVNPNLKDYKIATSMEIPEIIPIFVDMVDPRINNLGTKGLGEPPRIPAAAAVGNAVFNAIGVHIREIPMTPDKVLAALRKKEVS